MGEPQVRYNTEIPTEFKFKYREERPKLAEGDFYYGPDSDLVSKSWIAAKRGAFFGFASGVLTATYQPHGFKYGIAVEKFLRHSYPPLVAATAFGVTTSLAANIRHKEGPLNHAIGGYAAGTMIGACYKSMKLGMFSGLFLAAAASSLKLLADNGYFEKSLIIRKERVFDYYRTGWMTERPPQEGEDDAKKIDRYRSSQ